MAELKLEHIMAKAEVKAEALKQDECLYDAEIYHNMKGRDIAEKTRKLYQQSLSESIKETEDAIKSGNGYRINDAEIKLRLVYNLAEKILELHE